MIPKILLVSACACLHAIVLVPQLHAQARSETTNGSLELVVNYGGAEEIRFASHGGVLEPLPLVYSQVEPVRLACPPQKAGEPVTLSPLDGEGEIIAVENLSVANDGTVAFSIKAGPTPGRYRILVTIGADQFELQLHVTGDLISVPPGGPASTPPPPPID
jgi:hypothetical protein